MGTTAAARRWSAILAHQERSGQSLRQFAREHHLNANTLTWWRWKLARRGRSSRPAFVELALVDEGEAEARPAPGIELLLVAQGVRVSVDRETDLVLLRRVLEALC